MSVTTKNNAPTPPFHCVPPSTRTRLCVSCVLGTQHKGRSRKQGASRVTFLGTFRRDADLKLLRCGVHTAAVTTNPPGVLRPELKRA